MARRPDNQGFGGVRLGRLFGITALLAIVFSVGLIVGQRLLMEDGLPPVVAAGEHVAAPMADHSDRPSTDDGEEVELFSFYEALTSPEIRDISGLDHPPLPVDEDLESGDTDSDVSKQLPTPHHHDFDVEQAQPSTDDDSPPPARYTLQIASYTTMERARTEMDRLRGLGLTPHLVAIDVDGHGKHYRVRVGRFPDERHARAHLNQLANEHDLRAFVTSL